MALWKAVQNVIHKQVCTKGLNLVVSGICNKSSFKNDVLCMCDIWAMPWIALKIWTAFFWISEMNTIGLKYFGLGFEMLKLHRKVQQLHMEIPAVVYPDSMLAGSVAGIPIWGLTGNYSLGWPGLLRTKGTDGFCWNSEHLSMQFSLKQLWGLT